MLNKKNGKEKGNSINTGNIKEDIEILKNIIEVYESCSVPEIDMQVDITFGKKEVNAIKTILGNLEALCDMQMAAGRELKNAKQINEEHRKENGLLREEVKELEIDLTTVYLKGVEDGKDKYEQKIKDKIEELKETLKHYNEYSKLNLLEKVNVDLIDARIDILQELLQEEAKNEYK